MAPRLRRSSRSRPCLEALERRLAPATFTVLNADNAGAGSLRQAVLAANAAAGADDIAFDAAFFATPRTITLTAASGQLTISENLIVNGPGAALLTVSGGGVTRVFNVASGPNAVNATLNGLTVSGGNGTGSGVLTNVGGGILVNGGLTLNAAVVTGNSTASGGGGIGVANFGFITVRNSTIAGNTAGSDGGGVFFFFNGGLLMENSTVSGNVSGGFAGGGLDFSGTVTGNGFTIRNSTFANNTTAGNGGGICLRGLIGTAVIQNSTITGNSAGSTGTAASNGGGGIAVFGNANSILSIDSCIISGNSATNGRSDLTKATAAVLNLNKNAVGDPDGYVPSSGAGNLPAGAALNMYPLAAYGGTTLTVALGVGSAALNAGSNLGGLATDQRGAGFPRVVGAAADIGAFEGTIDVPSATGGPYAPVTASGGTTYTFDVIYSSTTPIDVSTLDNNDVRVTGPGGFSQLATFVSVTPAGNGTPRTATYRITAPGGTFGGEDNGAYAIAVQAGQVANTSGGATAATTVGTFSVNIPLTLTVTNLNNAGPGSLRQAILDANTSAGTADTIVFQPGLTGTITLTGASGQLNVTDSLTITGPGAGLLTISGGGAIRQFNISDNFPTTAIAVNLSGLTMTAGAGRPGAGISNPADTDGGAILNANETVVLDGVVISGNATSGNGFGGGMATLSTGAVTVRNSTIANNTAGSNGGGFCFSATGASLLMENSTVSGNTSGGGGGGISFFGTPGAGGFTVRNTTIAGNATTSTLGAGGGVGFGLASGTLLFQNSTITNNSSADTRTTVGAGGGGIAVITGGAAPILTLDSTIVSGNTVNAANANSDIATVAATVTNANFSAIGDPDGFTLSGASGNNLPFGTALNLMPLGNNGGPTATFGLALGSPAVNAGRNTAGLATDQRGAGFPRVVGAAADIGAFEGGIDAPSASGGPYANVSTGGSATYTFDVTYSGVTAINVSTLDNNDVRVTGPGGFSQLATFVGVTPAGNGTPRTATYQITAPGGTFGGEDNGTYTITVQAGQVANTSGGAAANTVVGTFVVGIPATYTVTILADGGAGSLRQAILDANASVNVPDTIVFQPGLTGTITLNAASDELVITEDLNITGPGAAALAVRGGGVSRVFTIINAARAITVGISGLTITGGMGDSNQSGTNYSFDGGGIYMADEIVTLDGVVLTENSCPVFFGGDGGGIATSPNGTLTIRNSTISNNSGNEGGGIYIGEGGSLLMENCTISGNTAHPTNDDFGGDGGGIFLYNRGSLLFENCTVSGNTALGEMGGGGIYSYASAGVSSVTVRNSTIAGNTAQNGGGITLFGLPGSNPVLLIQNSTITGNSAVTTSTTPGHGGGGIAVPANAALTPSISVVSSIVSGNTATAANGRGDIAMPNSTGVNVNFSAIGDADGFTQSGSSGNNLPVGATLGLGTLANNGGPTQTVSFAAKSPLRNAGSNPASLTTDQRGTGFVRVDGAAADIGAFELQPGGGPAPQVSSAVVNGGQTNTTQRSRVTSLTVTFDAQVTFAGAVANAFTLTRNVSGGSVTFAATASVVGGVTVVTLNNFTGNDTESLSLRDGRYTLTVLANQVSAGGTQMAGNHTFGDTQGLFRFYGDMNADRRVDISDFGFFSAAYLQGAGANNPALDFNGDGRIDITDFGQFSVRFFTTLP